MWYDQTHSTTVKELSTFLLLDMCIQISTSDEHQTVR